jgi:hypothetical protein
VAGSGGEVDPWEFTGTDDGDRCTLTATAPGGATWSGTGDDWFDALRAVRVALEPTGHRPLCAGARVNARVSGMLADSTRGEYVYLLEPGRSAEETVWIFAPAEPSEVAGVEEQDAFYERWLAGPHRRGVLGPVTGLLREWWFRVRYR